MADFWGISKGFNGLAERIGDAFSNNIEYLNDWGRDTSKNQRQDKSRQSQPSRKFGTGGANNPRGNNEEQAGNRNRRNNGRMPDTGMDNWQISPPNSNRNTSGNGGGQSAEQAAEDARRSAMLNEILGRLGEGFSFDNESVNSPELEAALKAQLQEIAAARGQVNDQYSTSNQNLINMHNAHEEDIRGQRGGIKEQSKEYRRGIKDTFGSTVDDAERRSSENMQNREEMAKRLGLSDSIEWQRGATETQDVLTDTIRGAESAEDSRLSDALSRLDLDLTQNRTDVNTVNNMELDRRSELENVLNELLGGLSDKSAEYKNQYTQDLAELRGTAEERAYQQFLEERQFDYDLLGQYDDRMVEERGMDNEMQMFREKQAIEAALNRQEMEMENSQSQNDAGLNAILANYGTSGGDIVNDLLMAAQNPEARFSDPASMLRAAQQGGGSSNDRQLLDAILRINNQ